MTNAFQIRFTSLALTLMLIVTLSWTVGLMGETNRCNCVGFRIRCEHGSLKQVPDTTKDCGNETTNEFADVIYFHLSYNKIIMVPNSDLSVYPNIEELYLDHNEISSIAEQAFSNLQKLTILDLSHNKLFSLQSMIFAGLTNIELINMSNNRIQNLPGGLIKASSNSLFEFDVSQNQIGYISPTTFSNNPSLTKLNLSGNKLNFKEEDSDIFTGIVGLTYLDLSKNRLDGNVPNIFRYIENLKTLDITDNLIEIIHHNFFKKLSHLSTLKMSGNDLTSVPSSSLRWLKSLQALDISRNPIGVWETELPMEIKETLKLMNLSDTKLTEIGATMLRNFTQLKTLDLSNNIFLESIIPFAFQDFFSNIQDVRLNNASLHALDSHLLPWYRLDTITLFGNLWDCNCHLTWLKNMTFTKQQKLICVHPPKLAGSLIAEVPEVDFQCPKTTISLTEYHNEKAVFITRIVLSIAALMIITSLVFMLLHRYRKRIPCLYELPGKYVTLYSVSGDVEQMEQEGNVVVQYKDNDAKTAPVDV